MVGGGHWIGFVSAGGKGDDKGWDACTGGHNETETCAAAPKPIALGCPYKKIYYNWSTGKAEKCIFCYPRIEVGQPTVCSETCVGRIRYLGVLLYDADKIESAASVADEKDLYDAQLGVFLDPFGPK